MSYIYLCVNRKKLSDGVTTIATAPIYTSDPDDVIITVKEEELQGMLGDGWEDKIKKLKVKRLKSVIPRDKGASVATLHNIDYEITT